MPLLRSSTLLALGLLASAAGAHAGTLCVTVRDGATLAPIAGAGIFLYQNDQYTGLYAATDAAGLACLDAPAGSYDLQVRVDDYANSWTQGVTVAEDPTSVDVFGPAIWLAPPFPNPAPGQVAIRFRAAGASVRLELFDLRGRLVAGWEGPGAAEPQRIDWDFRDLSGRPLANGLYLLRLTAGAQSFTRSLHLLR